jgi:hypothetical protein
MATESICNNCVFGIYLLHNKELIVLCTNNPEQPGELIETQPLLTCKNHKAETSRLEPPEAENEEIRYIPLTRGKFAIVNAEDYERLGRFKWFASGPEKYPYAIRAIYPEKGVRRMLYLHREIMKPPEGLVVDHINGNTLDNRRSNLRLATKQQNACNMRVNKEGCTSKYRGVGWHKMSKKWAARIMVNGRRIHLGLFNSEVEAAKAYDEAAKKYFGEFARLNFS